MTVLRIKTCGNAWRWYAHLVGKTVPYCGTFRNHYRSRTPFGVSATVAFEDAEIDATVSGAGEQFLDTVPPLQSRVYLSGPMTGMPDLNFPAFNLAAEKLRARGFNVVNPATLNPDPTTPWSACMRADIKALCDCDMLALLPGWEQSKGAHLEMHIAHRVDVRIVQLEALL